MGMREKSCSFLDSSMSNNIDFGPGLKILKIKKYPNI